MVRKLNLLSFGEEAAEMEPEEGPKKAKKKSAYDFLPEDKAVPVPKEEKVPVPKEEKASKSTTTIQPEKRQPEQPISEEPPKKKHKEEKPVDQEEQQQSSK